MAPHIKNKTMFKEKNSNKEHIKSHLSATNNRNKKKNWSSANKFFQGSVQEGKGFAFNRKHKIQHEYKKLKWKEMRRTHDSKPQQQEDYPEHLKHLYLAEQERLDKEEDMKRNHRRKGRADDAGEEEEEPMAQSSTHSQMESSHKDTPRLRKQKKISSYQKMNQEYEKLKEERERKREEYLKDKAQREEALKKYKEKKMATYQLLKKKTKKGQPNLNLQMELLLQKIQAQRK